MNSSKKEVVPVEGIPFIYEVPDNIKEEVLRVYTELKANTGLATKYISRKLGSLEQACVTHGGVTYEILDMKSKYMVYEQGLFTRALIMHSVGVECTSIPNSVMDRLSFVLRRLDKTCYRIAQISGKGTEFAQRMIYKYIDYARSDDLLVRIFSDEKFTNVAGAKNWVMRDMSTFENPAGNLVFTDLGDKPVAELGGLNLKGFNYTCSFGDYRLYCTSNCSGCIGTSGSVAFFKLDTEELILRGRIDFPVKAKSKIKLDCAFISQPLEFGGQADIKVLGESRIEVGKYNTCIKATDVSISGNGKLTLTCGSHSSVIGRGAVSQSYGRYIPNWDRKQPIHITVNSANIVVQSVTPNFSMGWYGVDNDVEIEVMNNGKITGAPEYEDVVSLDNVGITSPGSTKIEGEASYILTEKANSIKKMKL